MRVIEERNMEIHGQMVSVKVIAPASHRDSGLSLTKPKFQRTGKVRGERFLAREGEQFVR